jgi:DNA processing protein
MGGLPVEDRNIYHYYNEEKEGGVVASLKYWVWLAELRGVGSVLKLSLLEHFGDPDAIYYADPGEYPLVEGMTRPAAQALEEDKSLEEADRILGDCDALGLRLLTLRDTQYPDRLRNIYDPPILLYVQGRLPRFDEEVAIAMVGSRRVSPYALMAGEKLAFQLSSQGAIVVSGLAAGADGAAHRGALRAGGVTVGVIGGGHDIIFPRENRRLYEDVAVQGAILSEYPPGTKHLGAHFPVRNRILSGLCLATVVIEAPERSGALITAARALDQGRDVFCLPGQLGDWHCAGSNLLLRDGAGVVTEAWDILGHYAEQYPHKLHPSHGEEPRHFGQEATGEKAEKPMEKPVEKPTEKKEPKLPTLDLTGRHDLTDDQVRIVKALEGKTVQVDDLIEATQIPTRRVLSALTMLELDQIVTQESGKRFALAVALKY